VSPHKYWSPVEGEEKDPFPEPEAGCPVCDGRGIYLGSLGKVNHFRCRQCGVDFTAGRPT
jgi:tRNA(Ile2) C34 agmatinyltransferase TiaS